MDIDLIMAIANLGAKLAATIGVGAASGFSLCYWRDGKRETAAYLLGWAIFLSMML